LIPTFAIAIATGGCEFWNRTTGGPFHWHKHDDTDDFFLVLEGTLDIELHRPVARGEVHILLIQPTGTPNTGDAATAAPLGCCGLIPPALLLRSKATSPFQGEVGSHRT
jgi:hypothetical protein